MASYRRIFWSLTLPIAAVAYLIADKCLSQLGPRISDESIAGYIFAEYAGNCAPEPAEQLGYVLAILLPVSLAFLVTLALRMLGVFRRPEPSGWWLGLLALFSQICLLGFGAKAILYQIRIVGSYRFLDGPALILAAIVLGIGLAFASLPMRLAPQLGAAWRAARRYTWLPTVLATLWAIAFVVTGAFREHELPATSHTVYFHLPYTMGEYAAVVNGRVPLVDFFSQYQNLQNLLTVPIFRQFGVSVWSFTVVMCCFSTATLLLIYATLSKICRNSWTALVLFVPLVALAFYGEDVTPNGYTSNLFNYYAVGPIRYFGPSLLALFACWYLEKPTVLRLVVVAPTATLVALNNLDFGIPAAAGMLACALLFPPQFERAGLVRRIVETASLYLLLMLATLGLYCLSVRIAAGVWPMLGQLMVFQKTFALLGYFMLPMPQMGLHWVIYLTCIAAVVVPIYETFSSVHSEIADNRRIINGSLAYAGVASFGPLAYYVGRSHYLVLEATFLAWAFVLVQLLNRAWQYWRDTTKSTRTPSDFLLPIPTVAAVGLFVLIVPMVLEVPHPQTQMERLSASAPPSSASDAASAQARLISKYVPAGDRTVIFYENGHWLALKAGVSNAFPYSNVGSVILEEQLNAIMAALARLPVQKQFLFGCPRPELLTRLAEQGFTQLEALGDFAVWFRKTQ